MSDAHQEVARTTEKSDIRGVVVRGSAAGLAQEILAGTHRMSADEPASVGGTDTGASPLSVDKTQSESGFGPFSRRGPAAPKS